MIIENNTYKETYQIKEMLYDRYVIDHQDLLAAWKNSGKTIAEFGEDHYKKYGMKEGRIIPVRLGQGIGISFSDDCMEQYCIADGS